jgi:hypothetical protein
MMKTKSLLKTLNTLGNNVTKDSVIMYCMRHGLYLISDEPNFRMTFKSIDNLTKIIIYYNQNDNRYITINEAKEC